jgi:hypothetical protein
VPSRATSARLAQRGPPLGGVNRRESYISSEAATILTQGEITRLSIDLTIINAAIVAENLQAPRGLALDATHIYWAEYDRGRIARVARRTGVAPRRTIDAREASRPRQNFCDFHSPTFSCRRGLHCIHPLRSSNTQETTMIRPRSLFLGAIWNAPCAAALTFWSTQALADSQPGAKGAVGRESYAAEARADAQTEVHIESDWPDTEWNSCRTPCTATVPTEFRYRVSGPLMHTRDFRLPVGSRSLRLRVTGASVIPLKVSEVLTFLGVFGASIGGPFWIAGAVGSDDTSRTFYDAGQTATLISGGVIVLGIAGLLLFPRTHVETVQGERLDARAVPSQRPHFVGNGFVF